MSASKDKLEQAIQNILTVSTRNGYITENELIGIIDSFGLSFDAIERISGLLLNKGVIILDENSDKEYEDRAKIDYDLIYEEILSIAPENILLINYAREIIPAQRGEIDKYIKQAKSGNEFAKKRIFDMHFRVVLKESLYFTKKYNLEFDEVVNYASLGLLKAIDAYDMYTMEKFSTYAPFWIRQQIQRHCHFFNKLLFYPVHIREKIAYILKNKARHSCLLCPADDKFCYKLLNELRHDVNLQGIDIEGLYKVSLSFLSLDELIEKDYELEVDSLGPILEDESFDRIMQVYVAKHIVKKMLSSLSPRCEMVIIKRFGLDGKERMTLEEIGSKYNVTRERVRQIEYKAIMKLRSYAMKHNLDQFNY